MKNKVIPITKDVNFGASKTDTTKNVAFAPNDLKEGAVGIYGIHRSGSTNLHRLVLVGDAGSEVAGYVPAANFTGDEVFFAVGTVEGFVRSDPFQINKVSVTSQVYVAGVKQVINLGYTANATTGLLNETTTILRGDEASINVVNVSDHNTLDMTGKNYSGYARTDADSMYNILSELVNNVYDDTYREIDIDVHSNGTLTEFVEDPTVTNGSVTVTFGGNVTVATGAFIRIRGAIYEVLTGVTAGTTITLSRKYRGATETIDVSTTTDLAGTIATVTEYGLVIVDKEVDSTVKVATQELIQSATKSVSTAFGASNGSGAKVYAEEKRARTSYGALDLNDRTIPIRDLLTDTALNYDQYVITAKNSRGTSDPHTSNGDSQVHTEALLAFSSEIADTAGKNQSDFEDAMASLGITVATLF